jgi:Ca-activated chloride channel homolog
MCTQSWERRQLRFARLFWSLVLATLLVASQARADAGALGLFAPTTAQTGAPFVVTFNGTPGPTDSVMFVYPGERRAISGEYNSSAALIASPTTLSAPFVPGDYELLYVSAGRVIAARLPVHVDPARAALEVPSIVLAGEDVSVTWTGPGAVPDYIVFAEPGSKSDIFVGTEIADTATNPTLLKAPEKPGTYELRYIQRVLALHMILARVTVEVR